MMFRLCAVCCLTAAIGAEDQVSIYKVDYPERGLCGQEDNIKKSQLNPHYFFPVHFGGFTEGTCADAGFTLYKKTEEVEMHPVPGVHHNLTFKLYTMPYTPIQMLELKDPARGNRKVTAKLCTPLSTAAQQWPLYILGHGFDCNPEDYAYFCEVAATVMVYEKSTTFLDTDTRDLAADAAFLAKELPRLSREDAEFALYKKLSDLVVLGGHSMGGGTSVLAAAAHPPVAGMLLFAPGLYTKPDATPYLKNVSLPAIVVSGSLDCGMNALPKEAQPTYDGLASSDKALVLLKGANHCQWTLPTEWVGVCKDLHESHTISAFEQRRFGVAFLQMIFAGLDKGGEWASVEAALAQGEHAGSWEYVSSKISPSEKVLHNDCSKRTADEEAMVV